MKERLKCVLKDGFLPFLAIFLSMGVLILLFRLCRNFNATEIQPIMNVAREETNPTVGRLVWCILGAFLSVLLVWIAERLMKKNEEKLMLPWILSGISGIILWQSIGESLWHYGLYVMNDEGELSFVNFPRIESIQGIPFLILTTILFFALNGKAGFGVQSCLGILLANWFGHISMIGTYPMHLLWALQWTWRHGTKLLQQSLWLSFSLQV